MKDYKSLSHDERIKIHRSCSCKQSAVHTRWRRYISDHRYVPIHWRHCILRILPLTLLYMFLCLCCVLLAVDKSFIKRIWWWEHSMVVVLQGCWPWSSLEWSSAPSWVRWCCSLSLYASESELTTPTHVAPYLRCCRCQVTNYDVRRNWSLEYKDVYCLSQMWSIIHFNEDCYVKLAF